MPTIESPRAWVATLLALIGLALSVAPAQARENGFATSGCVSGCHHGGAKPDVRIDLSPTTLDVGQTVRLTVTIAAVNGNKAGIYLQATPSLGTLELVAGQSTKLSGDNGAVHSAPKLASGSSVTFAFDWTAPSEPGSVEFNAYAVSANGDRTPDGDGAGYAYGSLAFGCTPATFYPDRDSDGDGASDGPARMACAAPMYFAATHTDCNDSDERVLPGAIEVCNARDEDCDGQIDEGLIISSYCIDNDGDGHGTGAPLGAMGCKPTDGFGLCDNDCNDNDPTIFPGADELCNYRDDDCNDRIDDGAQQYCGEGWCRRASAGCGSTICTPGEPRAEECNDFDDDCDGVNDNGIDLCGAGKACVEGYCLVRDSDAGSAFPTLDAGPTQQSDAGVPSSSAPDGSQPNAEASKSAGGCSLVRPAANTNVSASGWLVLLLLSVLARRRERRIKQLVSASWAWLSASFASRASTDDATLVPHEQAVSRLATGDNHR